MRGTSQITRLKAELPSRCQILYSHPSIYVQEIPDFHAVISIYIVKSRQVYSPYC